MNIKKRTTLGFCMPNTYTNYVIGEIVKPFAGTFLLIINPKIERSDTLG